MPQFRTAAALALTLAVAAAAEPTREQALAAMRKAAEFYSGRISTGGGYHFYYSDDLSYGRSEHGEGLSQIETQREGTPIVGMAYLEAWDATKDKFFLEAARKAAQALVAGQLCTGGWDYIIEFDTAKRKSLPYRVNGNCASARSTPPSTLDDNVTQASLRLLMRVDRALGFSDPAIHEAVMFGLDSLMKAQYPNGAWPQRYSRFPDPAKYPVKRASYPESWSRQWPKPDYYGYYTFNDGSISDAIDTLLEAGQIYKDAKYTAAAERGGGFILLAQMPEPQPAWAQQYDLDMHPAWARQFEPPSVTGGESQSVIRTLFLLYRETGQRKYLDAAGPALAWLEKSVLPPPAKMTEIRRRAGEPALARFYELRTNRPLYITKGTQVHVRNGGPQRPDGYEVTYSDESVVSHYAVLISAKGLPALRREYERLVAAKPTEIRRPETLHGLSPWSDGDDSPLHRKPDAAQIESLIRTMDARGAWTEEGIIGRADRVVSVQVPREMIVTVNGRPLTTLNENDRIELFEGALPPRERILRSTTFARNLIQLAAWVSAERQN